MSTGGNFKHFCETFPGSSATVKPYPPWKRWCTDPGKGDREEVLGRCQA